ncbi:N-acetyltransferase [Citricoccus sp. SGAir0253]|nr:N-acetyltransferase [Citricoccus sp. SGAir0253]
MKARAWREAYGSVRDEAFFAAAEASLPGQLEHWRRELARGTALWLAEDARGRCVGMAAAGPAREPDGGAGTSLPALELYSLHVLEEAQGTGVADALLERAIGDAPCRLSVPAVDARARALYRRHGFVEVGDPEPMTGPWAGLDAQRMVRRGA